MAIILPSGRPAIDVVGGTYGDPDPLWAELGQQEIRARLAHAIAAVGRVDYVGATTMAYGGTAFVVGPNLIMTKSLSLICDGTAFRPGTSAVIDFGHESGGGESLRVPIEAVLYVDPVWDVELARAAIPPSIAPLRLSVTEADDLEDQDVVLIGYPALDPRSEAALMQQIFAGVFEIKRMLPGKLMGAGTENQKPVLLHDCTSTGGTAGGPLIEIATGEVVGIHLGGTFLGRNFASSAADLATDPAFASNGVQFAGTTRRRTLAKILLNEGALPAPANADLDQARSSEPDAPSGLEAIILPALRPSLPAREWVERAGGFWSPNLKPFEERINLALRSVGLVMVEGTPTASAFLVGDRLAVTASFATTAFVDGSGTRAVLQPGTTAAIDFSDALGLPRGIAMAAVSGVKFVHPAFHIAVLELAEAPVGTYVLNMAAQLPADLAGRSIAVLSYGTPGEIAGSAPTLFVQPGQAQQVGQMPGVPGLPGLIHDCTTRSGAAGGPVLDIGTGYAIGVQTHSVALRGGFAQPTWEIARDPHVWQFPIGFRPDPRPSWLSAWEVSATKQDPIAIELPKAHRWTVDDVPIDWTREEPKQMERILNAIEAQWALYSAESVGLQLGSVNSAAPPKILWRELIKRASLAGVLRRLVEELANDNPGIATQLRGYL